MHFYLPLYMQKCPPLAAWCKCVPSSQAQCPLLFQCFLSPLQSSQSCSSGRQNHVRLQSDSSSSTQVSSRPHTGGRLAAPCVSNMLNQWV